MKPRFLYLHGYQGSAHPTKLAVLRPFADEIVAPENYYLTENYFDGLVKLIENEKINYIIGNSFGGLNAFHLSNLCRIPCLLFNPVPPSQAARFADYIRFSDSPQKPFAQKTIVIGLQDQVIPPKESIAFWTARPEEFNRLIVQSDLEHRVNETVFHQICTMVFS